MKIFSIIFAFLIVAAAFYGIYRNRISTETKTETEFDWLPTESAPRDNPMQIIRGAFILEDGRPVPIPDQRYVGNGWAETGSIHLGGDYTKPAPVKVSLTWFSIREEKFYAGTFALPKDLITKLFQEGFVTLDGEKKTYSYIVVGMAPYGGVAVWLKGIHHTKEIGFFQATETHDVDIVKFTGTLKTIGAFSKMELEQSFSPEELAAMKQNPPPEDLWKVRYREKYEWSIELTGQLSDPISLSIHSWNGERDTIMFNKNADNIFESRPIPKYFYLKWRIPGGTNRPGAEIKLDETEIFSAFKKLFAGQSAKKAKFQFLIEKENVRLFLKSDTDQVELKNAVIKIYG